MHLLDTHPTKHLKWKEDKQKVEIDKVHRRPSAPIIAKDTVSALHDIFIPNAPLPKQYNSQITNIAFVGFGVGSGSYPNHKDECHRGRCTLPPLPGGTHGEIPQGIHRLGRRAGCFAGHIGAPGTQPCNCLSQKGVAAADLERKCAVSGDWRDCQTRC